jgi:hypothetical protein
MPLPCENTSVFAVPRSMARSDENKLNTDLMLRPFLFGISFPLRRNASPDPRSVLGTSHLRASGSWGTWISAVQIFLMMGGALAEAELMIAPLAKLPSELWPIIAAFWTQPKFF